MADVATTFSALSNDAPNVWIAREMYRLAERNLRLGKYATQYQLIQRMSKTLRVVRYKRLNLPTATLTEGTPPDAVALATENVDVTVEQWGIVVLLTDVAEITTVHPALQIAIDRTALAISEVLEREMSQMLLGGTQVFFNTATSRATILAAHKLNTATVLSTTVTLRNKGAVEGEGGLFSGVMSPQQEGDILATDATFQSASNFANVRALQYGEIGIWMGVRWARGNFLPIFRGEVAPDSAANTAVKAQLAGAAVGAAWTANSTVKVTTVARDITSNYERRISQEASFALGAGNTQLTVTTPTSTNYVYDIYVSDAIGGGGTARLASNGSRVAANTAVIVAPAATTAAVPPAAPAAAVEVFVAFVTGVDGYGRVELNGMSLQSYITPAGASFANPLAQGRKVGTKIMWKSFIIDNNYFARIETSSAYSASLPA